MIVLDELSVVIKVSNERCYKFAGNENVIDSVIGTEWMMKV